MLIASWILGLSLPSSSVGRFILVIVPGVLSIWTILSELLGMNKLVSHLQFFSVSMVGSHLDVFGIRGNLILTWLLGLLLPCGAVGSFKLFVSPGFLDAI